MATDILDVLRTKRDGGELTTEQIQFFIDGYTAGTIADEQAAALLMAIVFRGMTAPELATWTAAMIDTGDRADLSFLDRPTVDKHSTGGVGDKTSLVLVPLVVACGAAVPQLAGRGLGHTGGTLDKLESISGFQSVLPADRYRAVLQEVGGVMAGASGDIAPADRRLYALRDVTATVESVPLIASSVMSKKIAEGTKGLVLDVKIGSGSFLADDDLTRTLAETMVGIGNDNGVRTMALLTDMDQPLGRAVGNALEVAEALDVLAGGGPDDVRALVLALAREMLDIAGIAVDPEPFLDDGRAMEVFERLVAAQGGDLSQPLPGQRAHPRHHRRPGGIPPAVSTARRWGSRSGASVRAAAARRTPSATAPGPWSTPGWASACAPASPSSRCTPTIPSVSPAPWPRSTEPSRSATTRPNRAH